MATVITLGGFYSTITFRLAVETTYLDTVKKAPSIVQHDFTDLADTFLAAKFWLEILAEIYSICQLIR